ncbi:putative DNA binding domain-containing protein [Streptomyces canus]|uniref:AlbA family DNA-binding domain-containing protein n=1 Tax=Streptomyces canus TaxID=58343 RepID=UPI00224EC827|nr:ATP-binding protein [Streptomyces canus]MCX5256719.1 putative DNA binding domain-containing protein [Streptomyces canus]
MVTRLRRLEGLLGARLNDVNYSSIAELIGNTDAAEGEDLDYKRAHYASGDQGREELAKDVAAFANHTGGLLILGMAEAKGVPSLVCDVDLDDSRLRHIQQVVAKNTAPPVPYEAIPVHNPDAPGTGFLLLAVPRSPYAPHAVTTPTTRPSREALRYPRRGGSQTEWLTETDVATAYRARYTAAAERDRRLDDVERELADAIYRRTTPHLIVTLVPEQAGDMVIDSERFSRYQKDLQATQLYLGQGNSNFGRVTVGPRRLVVTEGGSRYSTRAELHRDGSAAIAIGLTGRIHVNEYEDVEMHTAELGDVVYPLLCALPFLASHARDRAGTSGLAHVRAALVSDIAAHPTQNILDPDQPSSVPFRVDRLDPATGRPQPLTPEFYPYAVADAGALLDDLADLDRGLLQATAALADELLQAYGYPETGLITRNGHLHPSQFTQRNSGAVEKWAHQRGLL